MEGGDLVRTVQDVHRSSCWQEQHAKDRDSKTDKRKGKFAIKQAMKTHRGSRGIALLFP